MSVDKDYDKDIKIEELLQKGETQRIIEFLLIDNAFDRDFLVTTIMEYYVNNCKLPAKSDEEG